jgi:hypothetical protein
MPCNLSDVLIAVMKRNPVIHVGVILIKPEGMMPKLAPVRHRTVLGICRKLMAPGLYRDQEIDGRRLLQRLLRRAERPSVLEVIIGVLLTARMCDQDIDPRVRAIIAVADTGTNPQDYPVEVILEPFDYDLQNDDGVAAFVANLVPVRGPKNSSGIVFS